MKDSIGGNAKTLMFVTLSPSDYNKNETHQSVCYAKQVKKIKNQTEKNVENERINSILDDNSKLKKDNDKKDE